MKASHLALVAALSAATFAAHADEIDGWKFHSGVSFEGALTRAQVLAEFEQARKAPNPYSISYNPIANFKSQLTREQVRADFLTSRDAVAAITGEDSGSAYLSAHKPVAESGIRLAGTPVRSR